MSAWAVSVPGWVSDPSTVTDVVIGLSKYVQVLLVLSCTDGARMSATVPGAQVVVLPEDRLLHEAGLPQDG